jgi:RimJ/RimL family protein N-acetyltransferase
MEHILLDSEELLIRHTNNQDLEAFASLVTQPIYGQYSPFGRPTKESAKILFNQILAGYNNGEYEFWVVLDKKKNLAFTGYVGYHPAHFENEIQQLFFMGFHQSYWGSRYTELAANLACEYAFKKANIPKLYAFVHPNDMITLRCTQTLGAQFEKEILYFDATLFLFSLHEQNLALQKAA